MSDGVHDRGRSLGVRAAPSRMRRALALTWSRRDGRLAFGGATLAYLLVYLVAAGDLAFRTGLGARVVLADDPVGKLLARTGPASFEPIALVDGYVFRALLAPGDLLLGLVLAALVGANLAVTYLAVVQPKACGIEAGTGVVAAVPALLSGTACCGPVVLLAVGVTASGALVSLFAWLVPIGALSLVASLAYVSGKIAI